VLQFVWATKGREPTILVEGREALHNCIAGQVTAAGCRPLVVGGTDDHVHVLVAMRTDVAPADLAKQAKGISSHFCKDQLGWNSFYWQDGYGVFSVSRSHVRRVATYIREQESHHSRGNLWRACEVTDPGVEEHVSG